MNNVSRAYPVFVLFFRLQLLAWNENHVIQKRRAAQSVFIIMQWNKAVKKIKPLKNNTFANLLSLQNINVVG